MKPVRNGDSPPRLTSLLQYSTLESSPSRDAAYLRIPTRHIGHIPLLRQWVSSPPRWCRMSFRVQRCRYLSYRVIEPKLQRCFRHPERINRSVTVMMAGHSSWGPPPHGGWACSLDGGFVKAASLYAADLFPYRTQTVTSRSLHECEVYPPGIQLIKLSDSHGFIGHTIIQG
jgi:hypothetical protein